VSYSWPEHRSARPADRRARSCVTGVSRWRAARSAATWLERSRCCPIARRDRRQRVEHRGALQTPRHRKLASLHLSATLTSSGACIEITRSFDLHSVDRGMSSDTLLRTGHFEGSGCPGLRRRSRSDPAGGPLSPAFPASLARFARQFLQSAADKQLALRSARSPLGSARRVMSRIVISSSATSAIFERTRRGPHGAAACSLRWRRAPSHACGSSFGLQNLLPAPQLPRRAAQQRICLQSQALAHLGSRGSQPLQRRFGGSGPG
jgi:hypothetical protein